MTKYLLPLVFLLAACGTKTFDGRTEVVKPIRPKSPKIQEMVIIEGKSCFQGSQDTGLIYEYMVNLESYADKLERLLNATSKDVGE